MDGRYIADTLVAFVLRQIERDMVDMAIEGQFTVEDIKNVFAGWFTQLEISPACALPQEPGAESERVE